MVCLKYMNYTKYRIDLKYYLNYLLMTQMNHKYHVEYLIYKSHAR